MPISLAVISLLGRIHSGLDRMMNPLQQLLRCAADDLRESATPIHNGDPTGKLEYSMGVERAVARCKRLLGPMDLVLEHSQEQKEEDEPKVYHHFNFIICDIAGEVSRILTLQSESSAPSVPLQYLNEREYEDMGVAVALDDVALL